MAQGDIIDVMLKSLFELIGWIFKTIFKLIWLLISAIFGAIFGKKKQEQDTHSFDGETTHQYSYKDCVKDLENANQEYSGDQLKERYGYLFVNLLVNLNMSIDEKCRLLENVNNKTTQFFISNPIESGVFYITYTEVAFRSIEQMFNSQSPLVTNDLNEFIKDIESGNLRPMSHYLGKIMMLSGLAGSSNGKFSLDYRILDKYNLPNWA